MKTLLLLGMGLFAAAGATGDIGSWTQISAVSALGLAVLALVVKTLPAIVKSFTDALDTISKRYANSMDESTKRQDEASKRQVEQQQRSDDVLRELAVQVARCNKET